MSAAGLTVIKGIDIVTYLAQDADRAKAFYRDTLGLRVTTDYGSQGAEFELTDGTTFGVWKMTDGSFEPTRGIMFAVDDLASAVAEFKKRGVAFEDDGAIEETPACFMAFAGDPEGNTFILHQRK
ncbi:MAG: VOC family protein [Candidatus Velthaea sp.]|jgi:catechol 2,3-dioxygenase-like lactoylglutathione lyase family enzyme